ncbi:metal-sensing transcriptional repressor [Patescibacteria group bacterium]|nr:metal-sensing transcriptional repressor [Patescibacteria group bacterium]MCL5797339.1 metal-sensing transcriptional repressor [Patescibacteria group bacterium]
MKINTKIKNRRERTLDHLNRIQGQIETLKRYIADDADCMGIAMLVTSIAKSFDALRSKTLEGSIVHQILNGGEGLSKEQKEKLSQVINLYKK